MSDSFILTRGILGQKATIAIAEADYLALQRAREVLVEALGFEQRVGLVYDNYIEYEATLLRGALQGLIYATTSYSEFMGDLHTVNRHLMNLLSACRAYIDLLRHFARTFFGENTTKEASVIAMLSEQYDSLLGYRVMEALRNVALHRGAAVHTLTQQFWWVEDSEPHISRGALVPALVPKRLAEEGGFKAQVLSELTDDIVDIRPLVKQYVAGISIAHGKVRDMLKAEVTHADSVFLSAIARYRKEGEDEILGLLAARARPNGTWYDAINIFTDLMDSRKLLERKHRTHVNLWKHFTTNEPQ